MTIEQLRRRIDELDRELVKLLNERAACAMAIGRLKREKGLQIRQPDRELAVLDQARSASSGPLPADAITRVFERIIEEARRLEEEGTEDRTTS